MWRRACWTVLVCAVAATPGWAAGPKRCCITIDDGPRPDFLPQALDVFDRYGVKVTFFSVGQLVKQYPQLSAECVARGHEVQNHSYSHPVLPRLSADGIRGELTRTNALIQQATGLAPTALRPPYGSLSKRVRTVADALDLGLALWTIDPLDWQGSATANRTASRILGALHPNAVILVHEVQPTLAALPDVLAGLQARGYEVVTYSELMRLTGEETPAAKRAITIQCGAGANEGRELAKGCGYALEMGLRAASPPGWTSPEALRFKLLVPPGAAGTLRLQVVGDRARPQGTQEVLVNRAALGRFKATQWIAAPLKAADTQSGEVTVEVKGLAGGVPRVGLVTFDTWPAG